MEPELRILPGAGGQIKNQKEPGLSLKLRTRAEAMAIWDVAPAPHPFLELSWLELILFGDN